MNNARTKTEGREVLIRVVVRNPLPGVSFAMQRGKAELFQPRHRTDAELIFDVPMRVVSKPGSKAPNVLEPYAQGPASDRFLYLNSGTVAGQTGTTWTRRAKIKTGAISQALFDQVLARGDARLAVEIDGLAKDGGPCCGTVPPVGPGGVF